MATWEEIRVTAALFEDDHVLALNKPSGISVVGERHEADIVQLAKEEAGETLHPVHRIDKVTSGLVLLAKDLPSHGILTRQFNKQTVDKRYLAIVPSGLPDHGVIDLPLGVGRKNRVRIAAPRERIIADTASSSWTVDPSNILPIKNYPSLTRFVMAWRDEPHSLLVVQPVSGRRHQIRVHLAWIGYPIVGDPLFGKSDDEASTRVHLHSWRLAIDLPWAHPKRLLFEASPSPDFWKPIGDRINRPSIQTTLKPCSEAHG